MHATEAIESDAGTSLMVRGTTEAAVEETLRHREAQGYKRQGPPAQLGRAWIGTLAKPGAAGAKRDDCRAERLGMKVIVTGPSESAVREYVETLKTGAARLLGPIEKIGEEWLAVVDAPQ